MFADVVRNSRIDDVQRNPLGRNFRPSPRKAQANDQARLMGAQQPPKGIADLAKHTRQNRAHDCPTIQRPRNFRGGIDRVAAERFKAGEEDVFCVHDSQRASVL